MTPLATPPFGRGGGGGGAPGNATFCTSAPQTLASAICDEFLGVFSVENEFGCGDDMHFIGLCVKRGVRKGIWSKPRDSSPLLRPWCSLMGGKMDHGGSSRAEGSRGGSRGLSDTSELLKMQRRRRPTAETLRRQCEHCHDTGGGDCGQGASNPIAKNCGKIAVPPEASRSYTSDRGHTGHQHAREGDKQKALAEKLREMAGICGKVAGNGGNLRKSAG